ncbi:MAG: DNA polymerase III subunit delta' [Prolixibacteraceae bacterium]|nr:DNA polymerase III subunit delta' [Burkholderiales bacterium]
MEGLIYPWVAPVLEKLPRAAKALPRALLLTGRPGLGKRAAALFLAQSLLCETQRDGLKACGTCPSCRLYQVGNHPDLRILEVGQEDDDVPAPGTDDEEAGPAKKPIRQISVDRIRALVDFVVITSHRGGAKVICIVPAEAMHPSAANAVLKILEEPPGDTCFLLVSHQPGRLLATIRSRCFHLPFTLPNAEPTLNWLKGQGIEQGELALAQGGYAPLAAVDHASDETFWIQRKALLNALAASEFDPVLAADCAQDIDGVLVSTLLSQWVYDVTALKSGGKVRYHLDCAAALQKIAGAVSVDQLISWYDAIIQFGRVAQHPLNKRLAMESLLSGYPHG